MKKIAAIVVFAFIALTAFANKYTDKLTVTVNGESMEQQTTIDVTKGDDGKYTLSLNNFCLESPNEDGTVIRLGVGNIILPDREGTTVDGVTTITYNDALLITEGNDAGIEGWMGPLLGPVPIEMVARFNDTQLYCEIHINLMDLLGQLIDVVFGSEPEAIAEVLTAPTITKKEGVRNTLVIGVGTTSKENETVTTYYTTDGTNPSADNGIAITTDTEIELSEDCIVKAVTVSSSGKQGEISVYEFTYEVDSAISLFENNTKLQKENAAYDLQGRKIFSTNRHAIYIVNGKKIIR
ncbi:MAG: chitobiase/beta-hexosaminidase C-terminal domain-containing protein [Prevotella sp.]|nr:chitobiase/beta-hexosaminidase C-terminal domain-containing protein [Prevotella sp.]MBQ5456542.1 chitobiase/beta-hexosaminidase C-terminal domain-containing protein [Prevotella sp.]